MQHAERLAWTLVILVAGAGGYKVGKAAPTPAPKDASRPAMADFDRLDRRVEVMLVSQAALRAEVAALGGARGSETACDAPTTKAPAVAPSPAPTPRTTEALVAEDSARAVLDDATRTGRWTSADRDHMREALAGADDDGRRAILRELAVAMNSKRIAATGLRGAPL